MKLKSSPLFRCILICSTGWKNYVKNELLNDFKGTLGFSRFEANKRDKK